MSGPALTLGVPASAGEQNLADTLESLRTSAERAALAYEVIVAVNGPEEPAPAAAGVAAFARAAGLPVMVENGGADASAVAHPGERAAHPAPGHLLAVRLLRLQARSKVVAWNAIRAAARGRVIVFADADVRVAPEAVRYLVHRLDAAPDLAIAAGREVAILEPGDGVVARVAALPHRFDFGNVPGRLYALRAAALAEPIPPTVLHEDAYLTMRLGRGRFVKDEGALVYLRPPTTWREYLRQRVRNEVGKLQLPREFPELYRAHGFGRYPWREFVRDIAPREYPLVALSLAARLWARARARREMRHGIPTGWAVLPSTKRWSSPEREQVALRARSSPLTSRGPVTGR